MINSMAYCVHLQLSKIPIDTLIRYLKLLNILQEINPPIKLISFN